MFNRESLVAKRDAIIAEIEGKIGKVKELTNMIDQLKASILVDRGRADAIESIIGELTPKEVPNESGEDSPSA
jgi:hypothetical protein